MEIYVKIVMLLKYIAPAKNFSRSNSKEDEMSSNKTKMAEIAKETLKRIAGIGIFCIMVMQIAYREQIDTTEISATIVDEKDDLEYGELGIEPLIIEKVLSTNIKVSEATETETEEIPQETVLETSEE